MSANALDILTLTGARENAVIESGFYPERRRRVRTKVHWRVLLRSEESGFIESVTQNLSSSGFYCLSPQSLMPGHFMVAILFVPAHDPAGEERTLTLECSVRIMRTEPASDGLFGIACRIDDFHMISADRA